MAYDVTKLTTLNQLKMLAEKIVADYATMEYVLQAVADAEAREHNYEMAEGEDTDNEYAKVYYLKDTLTGAQAGVSINIPKDMVVESGDVITVTDENKDQYPDLENGTYIHLVLANAENSDLYIPVDALVDVYTVHNEDDAMVLLTMSEDKVISADLSDAVKDILDKADTYELEPATADTLGGIMVGDSLEITEEGVLSVSVSTDEEVQEMLDEVFAGEVEYEGDEGDEGGDTEPGDEQP